MKRRSGKDNSSEEWQLQEAIFGLKTDVLEPSKVKTSLSNATPVWIDEDETSVDFNNGPSRLKKLKVSEFEVKISKTKLEQRLNSRLQTGRDLGWATVNQKESEDVNEILLSSESLVDNKNLKWKKYLEFGKIDIVRENDLNASDSSHDSVSVVKFSKFSSLVLVGSNDKFLRIFKVNGDKNPKVLGVKFQDFAMSGAEYINQDYESKEIMLSGRRPYLYSYDLSTGSITKIKGRKNDQLYDKMSSSEGSFIAVSGNNGYTHILDVNHKSWVCDLKMNGLSSSSTFLDEKTVITSSSDSEVYIWDLRFTGKCVYKYKHDDGTGTTALAAYSNKNSSNRFKMAVGSESGVVSLYDGERNKLSGKDIYSESKMKSIMNLTTPISDIVYHPSGDLLAIASRAKKDQLKIIHVSSGTVYSNWPTETTPLNVVTSLDFSPDGASLAIGNRRGNVLLYRLKQYTEL